MVETVFSAAFKKLWPHADKYVPGLTDGIIAAAPIVFPKYGWINDLAICHAMAEFSEECGCGSEMQENMNYSAGRLLQVFPSHFTASLASELQHNPRAIADQAYGSRMGNHPGTDDGWNFRGQGLSQVTGRDGYAALAKETGFDLLNHPEIIIAPETALECGVSDMTLCGCLKYALEDSLVGVASMLNVGHFTSNVNAINGYSMRKNWLALWKHEMGVLH